MKLSLDNGEHVEVVCLLSKKNKRVFKDPVYQRNYDIFSEGELVEESVVANFATTAEDGKTY